MSTDYNFCVFDNEIIVSVVNKNIIRLTEANNKNFSKIKNIIKDYCSCDIPLPENFETMINPNIEIEKDAKNIGLKLDFKNNVLYFNDKKISGAAEFIKYAKEIKNNKQYYKRILNFVERLIKNPSQMSIDDVWVWVKHSNLPISEDGCILAFKYVDENYKDCHTHTMDNSIGKIVSMPRDGVCSDRKITCSTGLHFCSKDYLEYFTGSHIMVLKIDPADIVSVPVDYNFTKGRCCKYEVLCEIEEEILKKENYAEIIEQFLTENKGNKIIKIGFIDEKNKNIKIKTEDGNEKVVKKIKSEKKKEVKKAKDKNLPKDKIDEMNKLLKFHLFQKEKPMKVDEIITLLSEKFNVQTYTIKRFVNARVNNNKLMH